MRLCAPDAYWQLSYIDKNAIVNGWGPEGLGYLVPDTVWGLSITEAWDIHDYDYSVGRTAQDKREADANFDDNMVTIVGLRSGWLLRWVRMHRCLFYYKMVSSFGEMDDDDKLQEL